MTEKTVTVVIPAYKAERTIKRCVESVLAQSGATIEIVVVIDGLLDRTKDIVLYEYHNLAKLIVNNVNLGSQKSRNAGLAIAKSEFVMFLDCDDFVEGPLVSGLANRLAESGSDIAFGPVQVLKEPPGVRRPPTVREYSSSEDLVMSWLAGGKTVAPCAIMWRTSFLRQIGGWNEAIQRNQDGEVVMRSILLGGKFCSSHAGRGVYVDHDSPDRITKRPENLPSAIASGDALLSLRPTGVSEETQRAAVGGYFYRVALRLYGCGRPDLAAQALERTKQLGLVVPIWEQVMAAGLGSLFRLKVLRLDSSSRVAHLLLGLTSALVKSASSRLIRSTG